MTDRLRDQLQAALGDTYTLERELGGGGMSRVFLAEERALGRRVVIKVLAPEQAADVSAERFAREIRLTAQLQHPQIVPVHAAGEAAGFPYYAMPCVEGESLRDHLARTGPLAAGEAIGILRDVAKALSFAHERGVVHRDIKPGNVLLTGGSVTVADFGIGKPLAMSATGAASPETLTQRGLALGTPAYMAPEQATGDPTTDHRADLYALGALAYEMPTGAPPFAGRSMHETTAAHLSTPVPPIAGRVPTCRRPSPTW
ncbi:MAG: serine/threonine protein kinase [Gemmatimonadetes bacterium]|nr:serine/threonine protein kinase [Gemmatimonadota bacterium]